MIINTKLAWNEECAAGYPSCVSGAQVYGYSLGFGQLELIFFFVNVLFMVVAILTAVFLFVLPVCRTGVEP